MTGTFEALPYRSPWSAKSKSNYYKPRELFTPLLRDGVRYSRYLAAVEMGTTCPGGRRLEREIHTIFRCYYVPKEAHLQCGHSEKVTVPYHGISRWYHCDCVGFSPRVPPDALKIRYSPVSASSSTFCAVSTHPCWRFPVAYTDPVAKSASAAGSSLPFFYPPLFFLQKLLCSAVRTPNSLFLAGHGRQLRLT